MSHSDIIYDSDPHFIISPITRQIKNESSSKTTLVQGDHKSERFSFEMPKIIEGHDMEECNRVEIHYINIGINGESHKGIYEANDMQIHPDDSEKVVFSWLLWDCVTKYEGKLAFAIRFACVKNDIVEYEWNTIPNDKIKISKGIDNSGEITEDDEKIPDLIAQWKETLFTEHDEMKAQVAEFEKTKAQITNLEKTKVSTEDIVTDYSEWLESSGGDDQDTKVPSMGVISNFFENANELSVYDIIDNIPPDAESFAYTNIPNVDAVKNYVAAQMNKPSETVLPTVLEPNTEYNLGEINNVVILFPEEANDGDVIYVVFTAGTEKDTVYIDMNRDFTSGLTDFIPEAGKKYEIYGRYDAMGAIWLCGHSEH